MSWIGLLLLSRFVLAAPDVASQQQLLTVSGKITGCSGEHSIFITLFGDQIFKGGEPVLALLRKGSEVTNGAVTYSFKVKPGVYTVSVFEDENDNQKLDMGMLFGPTEPSGFYRRFTAWRAPKFEDVKFELKADISNADIAID